MPLAHLKPKSFFCDSGDDVSPYSAKHPLNLVQIANGQADADLATIKAQLLLLTYPGTQQPYPVFLRYFWEFNINAGQVGPPYNNSGLGPNGNNGCFIKPGTLTGIPAEKTAPPLPQQFTNAWNHINMQLSGVAPVPQLTYVWNPNIVDPNLAQISGNAVDPMPYYPGIGSVDWIGVDGYDVIDSTTGQPATFSAIFTRWYDEFSPSTYGKPMMIGETGSCQAYEIPQFTSDQAGYILSLQTYLQSDSWSKIRALPRGAVKTAHLWAVANRTQVGGHFKTAHLNGLR
jgi:hypothetical protein